MDHEVVDHVDIGRSARKGADPAGLYEGAALMAASALRKGGLEALQVPYLKHRPFWPGKGDQLPRLGRMGRNRLFDEDVDTVFEERPRDVVMGLRRSMR